MPLVSRGKNNPRRNRQAGNGIPPEPPEAPSAPADLSMPDAYDASYASEAYGSDPLLSEAYGTYTSDSYSADSFDYSSLFPADPYAADSYTSNSHAADAFASDPYEVDYDSGAYESDLYSDDKFESSSYSSDLYETDAYASESRSRDSLDINSESATSNKEIPLEHVQIDPLPGALGTLSYEVTVDPIDISVPEFAANTPGSSTYSIPLDLMYDMEADFSGETAGEPFGFAAADPMYTADPMYMPPDDPVPSPVPFVPPVEPIAPVAPVAPVPPMPPVPVPSRQPESDHTSAYVSEWLDTRMGEDGSSSYKDIYSGEPEYDSFFDSRNNPDRSDYGVAPSRGVWERDREETRRRRPGMRASLMGRGAGRMDEYGPIDDAYDGYYGERARSGGRQNRVIMPAKPRSHRGRKIAISVFVIMVFIGGLLGFSGYTALNEAKNLQKQGNQIMKDINDVLHYVNESQFAAANTAAIDAKTTAIQMNRQLDGPVWMLASLIPVYGDDVKAVKTMVSVLEDATSNALVPLTNAVMDTPIDKLVRSDKSIDIAALQKLLGTIQQTAPIMQRCADELTKAPEVHLEQLKGPFSSASERIIPLNNLYQDLSQLTPIIGALLGSDGNRTYLIAAQNSDEMRSAGGFPGAMGVISIEDGKFEMGDFETMWESIDTENPGGKYLTTEEVKLFHNFGWDAHPYTQELNKNPDFTEVGPAWMESYELRHNVDLDGIISVTPGLVQDLLKITGPVTISDGTTLDGTNATKVLEHDLYWKYLSGDNIQRGAGDLVDALFAETATLAFQKIFENPTSDSMKKLVKVLLEGMENREFMIVLADPAEQETISVLNGSGAMNSNPKEPELGTFLTFWVGSKIGWYVDLDTTIGNPVKNLDGTTTYHVSTVVRNVCTSREAANGGSYIMGVNAEHTPGDMYPYWFLFAPAGGSISNLEISDPQAGTYESEYKDLQVVRINAVLSPGEEVVCDYDVTVSSQAEKDLVVKKTPTLTEYR